MNEGHTVRWVIATLTIALGWACSGSDPVPAASLAELTPEEHALRREGLRTRIQAELGEEYGTALPEVLAGELERGAELWKLLCLGCHGERGRGTRGLSRLLPVEPGDLTDPERAAYFSDRAKLFILARGSAGTPMIGWERTLDEASQLAVLAHLGTLIAARRKQ